MKKILTGSTGWTGSMKERPKQNSKALSTLQPPPGFRPGITNGPQDRNYHPVNLVSPVKVFN
jgi:hypothetical protein